MPSDARLLDAPLRNDFRAFVHKVFATLSPGPIINPSTSNGAQLRPRFRRLALAAHSFAALLAILIIIVHIYAGIWIKGTGRAMMRGTVTGGWAYRHHRKWLRKIALEKRRAS